MSRPKVDLNPQQRQAACHISGPALVLAGAGSGKTTVLTARAEWLMTEQALKPHQLLIVTFTNKAANEIRERIMVLTGQKLPFSGTFHGLCAKMLRRHGPLLGLDNSFTIYDADEQTALIKSLLDQHPPDIEISVGGLKSLISQAKNQSYSVKSLADTAQDNFQAQVARYYRLYEQSLTKAQALDFDDLLLKAVELLKTSDQARQLYQQQFAHVLVDEYQDTNHVQYQLTKLLASPHNNLFVVGDFCQSIYAWRGADYRNMLSLKKDFSDLKEYRLEQNYRSHQIILDAATQVVVKNSSHPILKLWTQNQTGDKIVGIEAESAQEEAKQVVQAIRQERKNFSYRNMAVLYRTNAQSRAFEEALIQQGVPYRLIGGTKFYERLEVKDVLAYLKYLHNQSDAVSHKRIKKLGKRRYQSFLNWLAQNKKVNSNQTKDAEDSKSKNLNPGQILTKIIEVTDYTKKYQKDTPENIARRENIQELIDTAHQFQTVTQFLENVALIQDSYFPDDVQTLHNQDAASLMSLHAAKGLEFEVVFVVGLEEGLLPHSRCLLDADQLEEERRLCYVGLTRAKRKLYLTRAKSRYQYGQVVSHQPSRFLGDIDPDLINWVGDTNNHKPARRLVDDDMLESVIKGEVDLNHLINH